jgi:hypothetical protein
MLRDRKLGSRFGVLVGSTVMVVSCASVLGIEEITPNADGGHTGGGSGTEGGTGGTETGGGGSGGDETGGGGVTGGSGGETSEGGVAGMAGDAGEGGAHAIAVHGRVIDRLRHPYPGIRVQIGSELATTDDAGYFTIANVTPPYDASFVISDPYLQVWSYQGLHRADPTLQVETEVFPYKSTNYYNITISAPPFPLPEGTKAKFGWGSPDGKYNYDFSDSSSGGVQALSASWSGPNSTQGAAHVLKWTTATDAGSSEMPVAYGGYDTAPATLVDGATVETTLDLTKNPTIPSATLSGTVTAGSLNANPHLDAYVKFPSGAAIKIVNDYAPKGTFGYVTPKLTGATISVVYYAGDNYDYPFSLVHKHGLAPDQTGVALALPEPPKPSFPADSTNVMVTSTTDFGWTGPDVTYVLCFFVDGTRFRVVTDKKQGRFPKIPDGSGITIPASKEGGWWLEINGPYTSIDLAAGPQGLLDTFDDYVEIVGVDDRDGVHVFSDASGFTTSATP